MTLQTIIFGLEIDLWLKLASLIGTVFLWYVNHTRRPRLEAFFTHGATHFIQQPTPPPANPPNALAQPIVAAPAAGFAINSHTLVVRNSGSKPALNVRILHPVFPQDTNVQVAGNIPYTPVLVPPHGLEMTFERLRAREALIISYLYNGNFPMAQFHTSVRFDEGTATFFKIQHVRIFPPWTRYFVFYLLTAGMALTIYLVLKLALVVFVIA